MDDKKSRAMWRVASAFWATALTRALLGTNFTEGMSSQAMQQGEWA